MCEVVQENKYYANALRLLNERRLSGAPEE